MPHVPGAKVRFFKPKQHDYEKWDDLLQREGGFKVGPNTILCSNHFR